MDFSKKKWSTLRTIQLLLLLKCNGIWSKKYRHTIKRARPVWIATTVTTTEIINKEKDLEKTKTTTRAPFYFFFCYNNNNNFFLGIPVEPPLSISMLLFLLGR